MKKLLLLTNVASICFLFASCQNLQQPKTESMNENKVTIKDSAISKDTLKVMNQTSVSGTVGTDKGMTKDTSSKFVKPHIITHNAPEQEKIDSIKEAKTKIKKHQ